MGPRRRRSAVAMPSGCWGLRASSGAHGPTIGTQDFGVCDHAVNAGPHSNEQQVRSGTGCREGRCRHRQRCDGTGTSAGRTPSASTRHLSPANSRPEAAAEQPSAPKRTRGVAAAPTGSSALEASGADSPTLRLKDVGTATSTASSDTTGSPTGKISLSLTNFSAATATSAADIHGL